MKQEEIIDFLCTQRKSFDNFNPLIYRDLFINGYGIRVLGIYFMDHGPKWNVKRHRHSFYEFHYILKGDVVSTVDESDHIIEEGEFYLMPPGTYHSHIQTGDSGHIGIALRWEFIDSQGESFSDNYLKDKFVKEVKECDAYKLNMKLKAALVKENLNLRNVVEDFHRIISFSQNVTTNPYRDDKSIAEAMMSLVQVALAPKSMLILQIEVIQLVLLITNFYSLKKNLSNIKSSSKMGNETKSANKLENSANSSCGNICGESSASDNTNGINSNNIADDKIYNDNLDNASSNDSLDNTNSNDNINNTNSNDNEVDKSANNINNLINLANRKIKVESDIVKDAIKFIEENYCGQIDVFDVANSVHFSYSYLAGIFRKETGETMIQYINRLRLIRALKLIKCTNKKISQISIECGFSTPNYFCMVFRRKYGRTPESIRAESGEVVVPD